MRSEVIPKFVSSNAVMPNLFLMYGVTLQLL